jgi:FkbM family methyltransferase
MIIIDIGSDLGEYISQINREISRSSIYAIEPDPIKFKQLQDKHRQWEKESDNTIHLLQIAVGDREKQTKLSQSESAEEILVDTFKIDTLFKPIKPHLIRINVSDRAEEILQGCTALLKIGKTQVLIVPNDKSIATVEFLKTFGYLPFNLENTLLFRNPQKDDSTRFFPQLKKFTKQFFPASLRYKIRSLIRRQ